MKIIKLTSHLVTHSHTSAELLPSLCKKKLEALGFTYHLIKQMLSLQTSFQERERKNDRM
jgi:hypothetical protein